MNVGFELLELFLLRHAEMLLFVDDQQSETCEADILGEQRVRPDDDVYATLGELLFALARVFGGDQPGQLRGPQPHPRTTLFETPEGVALLARVRPPHDN